MIDTHVHLEFPDYGDDRAAVMNRATEAGVDAMICVGGEPVRNRIIPELIEEWQQLYAAYGIHPHWATAECEEEREKLVHALSHEKAVAIGEIGLDYYYNYSPFETQKKVFASYLELARERELPVIIHSREAATDTYDILQSFAPLKGVVHCFSYTLAEAEAFMSLGVHLSFCGQITFKNCDELRTVATHVPLERLLLETDSPFLTPVPYRGQRNEPAYVKRIAETHALVRECSIEEVIAATTENACTLFGISL
jgi:TatD DNase family protein